MCDRWGGDGVEVRMTACLRDTSDLNTECCSTYTPSASPLEAAYARLVTFARNDPLIRAFHLYLLSIGRTASPLEAACARLVTYARNDISTRAFRLFVVN